jgi:fimbrial chaperone protein
MRRSLALITLVLGLVLQAENSQASAFKVTPVRVSFARPSSTLLTLKNESDQPLRFQISSFAWSQDPHGAVQLTPTEDVVFFPALLSLNPGEERKVRVAATVAAKDVEKTYRIFFEELPPLEKPNAGTGAQVRILTKMGIPIFVAPNKGYAQAKIESARVEKGVIGFEVQNSGNVHFGLQGVKVRGVGSAGEALFDRQLDGWYVLAGSPRTYNMQVTAADCSRLKKIVIEAQTDISTLGNAGTITKEFEISPGSCK